MLCWGIAKKLILFVVILCLRMRNHELKQKFLYIYVDPNRGLAIGAQNTSIYCVCDIKTEVQF